MVLFECLWYWCDYSWGRHHARFLNSLFNAFEGWRWRCLAICVLLKHFTRTFLRIILWPELLVLVSPDCLWFHGLKSIMFARIIQLEVGLYCMIHRGQNGLASFEFMLTGCMKRDVTNRLKPWIQSWVRNLNVFVHFLHVDYIGRYLVGFVILPRWWVADLLVFFYVFIFEFLVDQLRSWFAVQYLWILVLLLLLYLLLHIV